MALEAPISTSASHSAIDRNRPIPPRPCRPSPLEIMRVLVVRNPDTARWVGSFENCPPFTHRDAAGSYSAHNFPSATILFETTRHRVPSGFRRQRCPGPNRKTVDLPLGSFL